MALAQLNCAFMLRCSQNLHLTKQTTTPKYLKNSKILNGNSPYFLASFVLFIFPVSPPFSLIFSIPLQQLQQLQHVKFFRTNPNLRQYKNKVIFYEHSQHLISWSCLPACGPVVCLVADEDKRIQMRLYSYFLITEIIISSHFLSIPPLRIQPMSCFRLFLWVSFDLGRLG